MQTCRKANSPGGSGDELQSIGPSSRLAKGAFVLGRSCCTRPCSPQVGAGPSRLAARALQRRNLDPSRPAVPISATTDTAAKMTTRLDARPGSIRVLRPLDRLVQPVGRHTIERCPPLTILHFDLRNSARLACREMLEL